MLGCFAARELMRYKLSAVLIEEGNDVCTGISKANAAIVYPGYDNRPDSLKSRLTVRANAGFEELCRELDVPFSRCGSLMTACGEKAQAVLRKKLDNGTVSKVPGLKMLTGEEARAIEPGLSEDVISALYAPYAGTVDPWALCYGAYENALHNGCRVMLSSPVTGISREGSGYAIETGTGTVAAKAVINCAGLHADRVHELLFPPEVRIFADCCDIIIMKQSDTPLGHIVLHETASGKGISCVPTVEGRVLVESVERPAGNETSSTLGASLARTQDEFASVFPRWGDIRPLRCFAAPRPNPHRVILRDGEYVPDGKSLGDFVILRPDSTFFSLIGVKTPGLTCAHELGKLLSSETARMLGAEKNDGFDPIRIAIPKVSRLSLDKRRGICAGDPAYLRTVCLCEDISEGEAVEAIRRGAVTIDGIKRRCGAGLGDCQGARCRYEIALILSRELGMSPAFYLGEEGQP